MLRLFKYTMLLLIFFLTHLFFVIFSFLSLFKTVFHNSILYSLLANGYALSIYLPPRIDVGQWFLMFMNI